MIDTIAFVEQFLAGFGTSPQADMDNIRAHLSDDAYFHTGTVELKGMAAISAHFDQAEAVYGISTWRARDVQFAAAGNRVYNERWDDVYDVAGDKVVSLALASVFELAGDRIVAWRDYYNPDVLRAALQARSVKPKF